MSQSDPEPSPVVGIDLGTTHSAIGVLGEQGVVLFPNELGDLLTPSVVAEDPRDKRLRVGRTAKDIWAVHPNAGAGLFKRGMGTEQRWNVGRYELGAVELSALVLGQLKSDAERALGHAVRRAVITVPAYFGEEQRRATREAGELAGFVVERILNEPTAAAIAYGLHDRAVDGSLAVLDLGGGTFDVCIMDRFEGTLEVRAVQGQSRLGGEDFTLAIAQEALHRVGIEDNLEALDDAEARALLVRSAELLKRRLATDSHAQSLAMTVPPVRGRTSEPRPITFKRAELRRICAPLMEQIAGPIRAAFGDAEISRHELEELILVGGATRLPFFEELVTELVPIRPCQGIDPDLAIAHGAAIQGALVDRHVAVADVMVVDVASHSLGIAIVRTFGNRDIEGYFAPVIHRNTALPISIANVFSTIHDEQTRMLIEVYEGEARQVAGNRLLGTLEIVDIPPGPPLRDVEVRFTFDLDGILAVDARVVGEDLQASRVFDRTGRTLKPREARKLERRLKKLKRDPTDSPNARDLIARADLLMRELPASERDTLDAALSDFEAALRSGTLAARRATEHSLRQRCDQYDAGERW